MEKKEGDGILATTTDYYYYIAKPLQVTSYNQEMVTVIWETYLSFFSSLFILVGQRRAMMTIHLNRESNAELYIQRLWRKMNILLNNILLNPLPRAPFQIKQMKLRNLLMILFSLHLHWWHHSMVCAQSNETDRLSLLQFKESITNDPNGTLSSWNQSLHFCNWYGVQCSNQRVISLDLAGTNLRGNLSPYIGNLSFLQVLNLSTNSMYGQVPSEIGHLFRLQYLILANNTFGGKIPVSLKNCSKLTDLDFIGNGLIGEIPAELGSLTHLEVFHFRKNNLTGRIPTSLGNLTALKRFSVSYNLLEGSIPEEIGLMKSLLFLAIGVNNFSGELPSSIFNISSIEVINTPYNQLTGTIPINIGLTLPNLQQFVIAENQFTGFIPPSIANASMLKILQLSSNNFTGQVPTNLGNLKDLQNLLLNTNNLGSNSSGDLSFIESLTNCSELSVLYFNRNNLGGVLPNSISDLSTNLVLLSLGENQIYGNIPATIGNLNNLRLMALWQNHLTGVIPESIGNISQLQQLDLWGMRLSGPIPSSIVNLTQILFINLSENMLEGSIPPTIGYLQTLQYLDISTNRLTGTIPQQLFGLSSLSRVLNLSANSFEGQLSRDIGKLNKISVLDISRNNFSGEIPSTISDCSSLEYLYMQGNSFQESIPSTLASMTSLRYLDLSRNNLTGQFPKNLSKIEFLFLNLSFNNLEGEVPIEGVFENASAVSLVGNSKLCGGITELHLLKCLSSTVKRHGKSLAYKLTIIIIPVVLFIILICTVIVIYWMSKSNKNSPSAQLTVEKLLMVSYKRLHQATEGFSAGNLIGSGGFGSVYKAFLDGEENMLVAVKVLKLEEKEASKSFITECKVLRNVRHRNLAKMLTYCSGWDDKGNEFRALVFEFMENSSLEKWLHTDATSENQSKKLDFLQRLNIAIDVASAMHYLHDLCETAIIHCDLKPSNILLDKDMVAHVGDFGLAKLLFEDQTNMTNTIALRGSIGYTAPEYGMGGEASKSGDVYSYGILVLEILTGKRPSDEMFKDGVNLHDFVKNALPENISQIVDSSILPIEKEDSSYRERQMRVKVKQGIVSMLQVGVSCSAEVPRERMSMEGVNTKLQHIKKSILDIEHGGKLN